ncbi:hypothetical protein NPIL_371051 [Nephila pilipes]|uniref:Uncharacterized protein n=1 Tax=Nephila pilipes TaxID=299642 RepID=A0A8X6NI98_NEPPI|nr:hypothetical protein NPIL_371051 [Nephila pilipes]
MIKSGASESYHKSLSGFMIAVDRSSHLFMLISDLAISNETHSKIWPDLELLNSRILQLDKQEFKRNLCRRERFKHGTNPVLSETMISKECLLVYN